MYIYQFRKVERNDFPMLGEWLRSPELLKWWDDATDDMIVPNVTKMKKPLYEIFMRLE